MPKKYFNLTYLYDQAETNAHNGHRMHRNSRAHRHIVKSLRRKDKHTRELYPFLNLSLERKYLKMLHLAEGIGAADDGCMKTSIVTNYMKANRKLSGK